MRKFDYSDLDATLLTTVVVIHEESSVSKAAVRLNVSQSTLSHRLDRARQVLGDPLFVRNGRGIVSSQYLTEKIPHIRNALISMRSLFENINFDPVSAGGTFTIAATDYERTLFLYDACHAIIKEAPNLSLNFVWDQYDNTKGLRRDIFDIAIAPYIGQAPLSEIHDNVLFQDKAACFFDRDVSSPIISLEDYLSRKHVSVIFSENDESFVDRTLRKFGKSRNIVIRVPSLSEIPQLLRGSDLIATLPQRASQSLLQDFGQCPIPFKQQKITYGMFWHSKNGQSPMHEWIRQKIIIAAEEKFG